MRTAEYWIKNLNLLEHPEGGYYREIFRSGEQVDSSSLPGRYSAARNFGTSIYYLLRSDQKSRFHKLKSDEIWYFHDGHPAVIHMISPDGEHFTKTVGLDCADGELPQAVIEQDHWFAIEVLGQDGYVLVGCSVFPGFEFEDFQLGERNEMLERYPQHVEIIERFT